MSKIIHKTDPINEDDFFIFFLAYELGARWANKESVNKAAAFELIIPLTRMILSEIAPEIAEYWSNESTHVLDINFDERVLTLRTKDKKESEVDQNLPGNVESPE